MRNPILLYSAAFLVFLVAQLILTDDFNLSLRLRQDKASVVSGPRAAVADVVTQTGENGRKRLSIGYLNKIIVYPGVRLVHDPSVGGRAVVLSGPQRMIDLLRNDDTGVDLYLDFTRPIVATDYLTVAMDLAAHGDYPQIQLAKTLKSRSAFPPLLVTPTPISVRGLKLNMVEDVGTLRVDTEQLDISGVDEAGKIEGTTKFLLTGDDSDQRIFIPGLTITGGFRAREKDTSDD